jgi:hypothetical protein
MATQNQIAANRQNALKSTGPRTDEGKAASSRNATSHGLFSEDAVLAGEERPAYEAFAAALHDDLKPAGGLEESQVQQVTWLQWRINRIARIETGMLDFEIERRRRQEKKGHLSGGPKDQTPRAGISRLLGIAYCQLDQTLGRLSRYESHLRRSMHQCLQDLESMQLRRLEREKDKEKTNPISPQPVAAARPSRTPDTELLPAREPDEELAISTLPSAPLHAHPSAGNTAPDGGNLAPETQFL